MRQNIVRASLALVLLVVALIGLGLSVQPVQAQGCSITEFSMNPTDPYRFGDHVVLNGRSTGSTVKFQIKNLTTGQVWDKAEIGQPNQQEVWKTEETGTGTFEVSFWCGPGGGWQNATKTARTVYVAGGDGDTGDGGPCQINSLFVTPGAVSRGGNAHFSASSSKCSIRAMKLAVDGTVIYELGTNTISADYNTSNSSVGWHEVCVEATSGDWNDTNATGRRCETLEVIDPVLPTPTPFSKGSDRPVPTPAPGGNGGGNNGGGGSCSGSQLFVGAIAKTERAVDVFSEDKFGSASIAQIRAGNLVTIIGGATCNNGIWWNIGWDGKQGYAQEKNSNGRIYLTLNGGSNNGGGNSGGNNNGGGNSGGGNTGGSDTTSCGFMTSQIQTGDRGTIIYPYDDGIMLRAGGNVNTAFIAKMMQGWNFTMLAGSTCADGYRWRHVRLDDGREGWAVETDNEEFYMAKIAGGNGGGGNKPPEQPGPNPEPTGIVNVSVHWDATYVLEFNTRTCTILNGSEIVVAEIQRISEHLKTLNTVGGKGQKLLSYFSVNDGGVEQFRMLAETELRKHKNCNTILYQYGTAQYTDMSGPGNIIFGYLMDWMPVVFENQIADILQFINENSIGQYGDNLDDRSQRTAGRLLAGLVNLGETLSPSLMTYVAEVVKLY